MRAVIDTNVLISALVFGKATRELLRGVMGGRLTLVTSKHLLDELENLLVARFGFSPAAAAETRSELEVIAQIVHPSAIPEICRDPDDNHVLAAASAGNADLIITGDKDLLDLKSYQGIPIVPPARVGAS